MTEHPDLEELLDRWEDIALDHSTWTALSRMLDMVHICAEMDGVAADDVTELSTREMGDMVRAGICFVQQTLPQMEFRDHDTAVFAVAAVAVVIDMIAVQAAGYDLYEARRLAAKEAFGL